MKIKFRRQFDKSFQVLRQHTKESFYDRLKLFEKDPFDPILNNHSLKGKYNNKRSINIT